MKRSKYFFAKVVEKANGVVFWNGIQIRPQGGNRIMIKDEEYKITPGIQGFLTNTKLTTRPMDNEDQLKIFNSL